MDTDCPDAAKPDRPGLLYVTHVDWGHIRQRPHHIACGLAGGFDVTVASPVSRRRALLVANPLHGVRMLRLLRLPGSYRSATVLAINATLCAWQLRRSAAARDADAVFVTSPECYAWVAPWIGDRTLAYDCMDDALAFAQDATVRSYKASRERALLARADHVFCSSGTLAERCIARGAPPERTVVVPNGWDPEAFPVQPAHALPGSGPLLLGYFGTLGGWLDFGLLEAVVRACPEVTIRLVGPNEGDYVSPHPRLVILPPVPHASLANAVADCDAMLLPFRVNDLIRAVDPVKLYEYVALGKSVVAVRYPGIECFAEFVTFYDGADDLVPLLRDHRSALAPALPAPRREAFLDANSWACRVEAMRATLAC
jgi:glycosyltransferase involved in cell wall biosynthesis